MRLYYCNKDHGDAPKWGIDGSGLALTNKCPICNAPLWYANGTIEEIKQFVIKEGIVLDHVSKTDR